MNDYEMLINTLIGGAVIAVAALAFLLGQSMGSKHGYKQGQMHVVQRLYVLRTRLCTMTHEEWQSWHDRAERGDMEGDTTSPLRRVGTDHL